MKMEYTESLLKQEDIREAVLLSSQIGWNQTKSDWARLIELNPETCFAFRENDQLVGTATLATYGTDLGWIGMVIVDTSCRGKGIGRELLSTVIHAGRNQGCKIIGLDATDQGRELYMRYGFHNIQPIDRWTGSLLYKSSKSDFVENLKEHHLPEAIRLDLKWSGYDRSRLICRLFHENVVRGLGLIYKDQLKGFAFIREGQHYHHLGPILTDTVDDCTELLDEAARKLQGEPVSIDSIRREVTTVLLRERGLKVQRRLTRMTLDKPQEVLNSPEHRAAVSFEWG